MVDLIDNTYIYPKHDDIEIEVGDKKQSIFYPRMKIKRWDNEVNFSVGLLSTHTGINTEASDKVEWDDGHGIKTRFYEKPGDEFEFEIEFAEKPKSNILHLSIKTKGLDFFYQPELTAEESAINPKTGRPDCTRPENVVGSYAVYHSTMRGDYKSGNNYRAGKFCHIYRPYVEDSKGWRVWCDLNIDEDMQIVIPKDFIEKAIYPIVVDPIFGHTSAGGTGNIILGNYLMGALHTSPSDIDVAQNIYAYAKEFYAGPTNLKGVMVLHSNLNIITNGVTSSGVVNTFLGEWILLDYVTEPTLAQSTDHVISVVCDSTYCDLAYDSGATNQGHVDTSNSYSSPTNPTDVAHTNRVYSIYCTYTVAASTSAITTTTNLLIKKLNDILSISSNLLIKKLDSIISTTVDLLIKKLNSTIFTTIDVILAIKERIDLRSYINISDNKESEITTVIDIDSNILKTISKFSETDSDISINRHSMITTVSEDSEILRFSEIDSNISIQRYSIIELQKI